MSLVSILGNLDWLPSIVSKICSLKLFMPPVYLPFQLITTVELFMLLFLACGLLLAGPRMYMLLFSLPVACDYSITDHSQLCPCPVNVIFHPFARTCWRQAIQVIPLYVPQKEKVIYPTMSALCVWYTATGNKNQRLETRKRHQRVPRPLLFFVATLHTDYILILLVPRVSINCISSSASLSP